LDTNKFDFDFKATARLAQGTAAVVATLLAFLDTVALIPEAKSLTSLLIDFIGLWISALILWYVSFQIIIHTLGFCLGSLKVNDQGLKLGHFGRAITWDKIEAVAIEPQPTFSQVCRLKPRALRLTLFERRKEKLTSYDLPSFFYSRELFQELIQRICKKVADLHIDSMNAFVFREIDSQINKELKNAYAGKARQRLLIVVVIAIGLVIVMGRKTTVNYLYNSGNHYYHEGNYTEAKHSYQKALKIDPVFTFAWAGLAATEFHLNNFQSAADNWRNALRLKPDFVEPKVGLAYLLIQQGKLNEAKELLNRALRRDPRNSAALLNMADINLKTGNSSEALRIARFVLTIEPNNPLAADVLAKARRKLESSTNNIRPNLKP
jgi:tetratricopeptide (TPR) repeat protein